LALKYAQDWAFLNGAEPEGAYVEDFQSHYSKEQREYIKKVIRMMRFTNSLGNTVSRRLPNSEAEPSSAACIIQNREYAPKTESEKGDGKDHDNIVAHPPVIFGIVLVVGFLIHKCFPLALMSHPGSLSKVVAGILFVLAGIIMVSGTRLMLQKKIDPRPDRPTTAIVTEGLFRYSRNPLYLSLMLIYGGIAVYANSLWLFLLLPLLFFGLERGVVLREEKYLEGKFGDEYLQYKKKVRRWV
jgi:protein-S-isoprenylcysteine O-methyltransferase Ste14